jgi:hypothetical protein
MSKPLNALEAALFGALEGETTMTGFFDALTAAQIVIPTVTEVKADGSGFAPLTQWRQGVELVLAFTNNARIGNSYLELAPYLLTVDSTWLIRNLAYDRGLLLFAGPDQGLMVTPKQLAGIRAKL